MKEPTEPIIVQKRGIDVTPYVHGIYCQIEDGEPFVNPIALRRWTDDGSQISVMLDSHNFARFGPDDMVDVVELAPTYYNAEFLAECMAKDAVKMANRPKPPELCPTCKQEFRQLPAASAADRKESGEG